MKKILFILSLFAVVSGQAQTDTIFTLIAEYTGSTTLTDSTFNITANHPFDQLGQGFLPSGIQVGYRCADAYGRRYEVIAVNSTTFGTSDLDVKELQNQNLAPSGVGLIHRKPDDSDRIPVPPSGNTGLAPATIAKLHIHNVMNGGGTGSGLIDSTRLIQDSILVYWQDGIEIGRDTISGTGGGGGSNNAIDINITDLGNLYVSTEVENALQEVGSNVAAHDILIGNNIDSIAALRNDIPTLTSELQNDSGFLTSEVDGSVTNELQNLSISNDTLTISQGNSVVLPAGGGGTADGVATAGTYDAVNDEIDITVASPGANFSIDVSSLAENTDIPTNVSQLTNDVPYVTTNSGSTNKLQMWNGSQLTDAAVFNNPGVVGLLQSSVFWTGIGTAANPAYSFNGDADNGLYMSGNNQLSISTSGSERWRFNSVGLAALGASLSNPQATLHIFGTSSNLSGHLLRIQNSTGLAVLNVRGDRKIGILTNSPEYIFDIVSSDAIRIPSGNTTNRPIGAPGVMRHNTTTNRYEVHDDTGYNDLAYLTEPLTGDLDGTLDAPIVSGIAGNNLQPGSPSTGDILQFYGGYWNYTEVKDTIVIPIYCQPYDSTVVTGNNYRGWMCPASLAGGRIISVDYALQTPGSDTVSILLKQTGSSSTNWAGTVIPVAGYVDNVANITLVEGDLFRPDISVINGTGHKGLMLNLTIEK